MLHNPVYVASPLDREASVELLFKYVEFLPQGFDVVFEEWCIEDFLWRDRLLVSLTILWKTCLPFNVRLVYLMMKLVVSSMSGITSSSAFFNW